MPEPNTGWKCHFPEHPKGCECGGIIRSTGGMKEIPITLSLERIAGLHRALDFMAAELKRTGRVQDDEDAPKSFPT